ncbi:MAG: Flp pilus assembly complex ATPase component TadA [Phycisphaeraceae bacterium]|nr:Flp pilus assembly complex ATPase component TadA [Phycisphaeraceae bacterium]
MELWLFDHSQNEQSTLKVDTQSLLVGRDDDCHVKLKSTFVARKHLKIQQKGNQFFVENLSRAATRVAGRDLGYNQSTKLDFGDEIQIGQYSLAMLRPGDQEDASASKRQTQQQNQQNLMQFEQQVHAQLLDRMNLRATADIKKTDTSYLKQMMWHLRSILDEYIHDLDKTIISHTVYSYLHRMVLAEVVRQCQGKVQTDYKFIDLPDAAPSFDQALTQIAQDLVDTMPLLFDPTCVAEDVAIAEEVFEEQFDQIFAELPKDLRHYIVHRIVSKDLVDIMLGLGPLQDLLEMANVTEIMVVGKDRIYVEKNGIIQRTTRSFFSDEILISVIERILTPVGRRVDHSNPMVDARLADGSRVNIVIPPLSLAGPTLTIRKFSWIPFTIDDLVERGSLSTHSASFLQGCVLGRLNIIISGGTGSGKTTLLNVLSSFARQNERILTIEESAELQLPQPHVVPLEARPANVEGRGEYAIRDLLRNALRMRPDRIIVGEVRGPEALDMLQAMNTGHDGSLSTLHANTPVDAMKRLETLVLMAVDMPMRAIREQITSAVNLVVQVTRFSSGQRRITAISEVIGLDHETNEVLLEDIFVLRDQDQDSLRHTGYIPTFAQRLIQKNFLTIDTFL